MLCPTAFKIFSQKFNYIQFSSLTEGCYVDFFDKLRLDSYLEKQLLKLTFCFFALNVGLIVAWPPKTICENYKGK